MLGKLAIHGGEKIRNDSFGKGNRFGELELKHLSEALEQNTLFYWYGTKVKEMCKKFSEMYGAKYCVATSSGTAAIHTALGTSGVTVGDEVITSPITDIGTIIGILYQNAIPVFADLDLNTYNMTAESIEKKITNKTKAILIVHLTGNPSDMDPIMDLAKKYGIMVIEDCAQAYYAYYKGRLLGTIGDIGCFSLNDFKHISAGDGGMVLLNNEELYRRALRFTDKNYDRLTNDPIAMRKVPFLAPNYRMTELQGAVALGQLERVEGICKRHSQIGDAITKAISGIDGIIPPKTLEGCKSSYWFYLFRIDEKILGVDREEFVKALNAEGIPAQAGYIPCCVYDYDILKNHNAYEGDSRCPFECPFYGKKIDYNAERCINAEIILNTSIRIGISQFYTDKDVEDISKAIIKVSKWYLGR